MLPWYQKAFENSAKAYDKEPFNSGTVSEVDYIEEHLGYRKNAKILDVACGTGRHSIELQKRGYQVVGIDISPSQIAAARAKAKEAGVTPTFLVKDARHLNFEQEFDLVLNICEGGFGLLENDQQDFLLLQQASRSLSSGGSLILTVLNALHRMHQVSASDTSFDPITLRESFLMNGVDDDGNPSLLSCVERYYTPSEIRFRLELLGFDHIEILGCPQGDFSKASKAISSNDLEMLVTASCRRLPPTATGYFS